MDLSDAVNSADYLDLDYDTITQTLVLTVGWASSRRDESLTRRDGDGPMEIGVLMHEPNPDPEDIQFGGFLTLLGQDATPSKSNKVNFDVRVARLIYQFRSDPFSDPHSALSTPCHVSICSF
jgi:hypothetical protein